MLQLFQRVGRDSDPLAVHPVYSDQAGERKNELLQAEGLRNVEDRLETLWMGLSATPASLETPLGLGSTLSFVDGGPKGSLA
jgi:hypothetical protein